MYVCLWHRLLFAVSVIKRIAYRRCTRQNKVSPSKVVFFFYLLSSTADGRKLTTLPRIYTHMSCVNSSRFCSQAASFILMEDTRAQFVITTSAANTISRSVMVSPLSRCGAIVYRGCLYCPHDATTAGLPGTTEVTVRVRRNSCDRGAIYFRKHLKEPKP